MSFFNKGSNQSWTVSFNKLPSSLDEIKALEEANLNKGYYAAALLIPALCLWVTDKDKAIEIINFLRGPAPLSTYEIQFISERLRGNEYVPKSYFQGTNPENGYEPSKPYTVEILALPNSFGEENYAQLYLKSSGADSPRPVKLRKKPSSGQWFLTDQMLLAQIRKPVSEDPWA